jgi:hypothetical protein
MSNPIFDALLQAQVETVGSSANYDTLTEAGLHSARVSSKMYLMSNEKPVGKDEVADNGKTYPWSNHTPQILLQFATESGVVSERYNLCGYVHPGDENYTEADIAKDKSLAIKNDNNGIPYVVQKSKVDGKVVIERIVDKERTQKAINKLNYLLGNVCGLTEQSIQDALDSAIEDRITFGIEVAIKENNGKSFPTVEDIFSESVLTKKLEKLETASVEDFADDDF